MGVSKSYTSVAKRHMNVAAKKYQFDQLYNILTTNDGAHFAGNASDDLRRIGIVVLHTCVASLSLHLKHVSNPDGISAKKLRCFLFVGQTYAAQLRLKLLTANFIHLHVLT